MSNDVQDLGINRKLFPMVDDVYQTFVVSRALPPFVCLAFLEVAVMTLVELPNFLLDPIALIMTCFLCVCALALTMDRMLPERFPHGVYRFRVPAMFSRKNCQLRVYEQLVQVYGSRLSSLDFRDRDKLWHHQRVLARIGEQLCATRAKDYDPDRVQKQLHMFKDIERVLGELEARHFPQALKTICERT